MTLDDIKEGDMIGGRYRVINRYPDSMGYAYACNDLKDDKTYVLTTTPHHETDDWIKLGRHCHIVQAIEKTELDGESYLKLEYIRPDKQGRTNLSDYLNDDLKIDQIIKWAIQFCEGMEYANSNGINAHGDIKPANIMINNAGILKISEYVKFALTIPSRLPTSLSWAAPESLNKGYNVRTDIYAFGVVLYQMINHGEIPIIPDVIKGHPMIDWMEAHQNKTVPPIDSPIFPVVKKCLEKDPEDRYQNFQELRDDLENITFDK